MAGPLSALLAAITVKEKSYSPNRPATEAEIVAIIKGFAEGVRETLQAYQQIDEPSDRQRQELMLREQELALLESFLPQQMSEGEIEAFVQATVLGGAKTMGEIMASLKAECPGRYDGRMASSVAKKVLDALGKQ